MANDFVIEGGLDDRAILEGFKRITQAGIEAGRKTGAGFEDELKRFGARSVAALQEELGRLQSRQTRVNIDSEAFTKANARIRELQGLIDQANRKKLLLNVDPGSIIAVRQRLQEVNAQLEKVKIGSAAFIKLRSEAAAAETELSKVSAAGSGIVGSLSSLILPAAGALGAILAIGAGVKFVGDQVRAFDSAGAAVRTLGVNSDVLAGSLLKVSQETGGATSQVELLKAAYDVASSGFASAADATNVLRASNFGAIGGFSDLNTVANATTSVLNAYGLSSEQAGLLVDKFIQTQNDGKIVLAEYASQIGKLAPIAAAAGVSIDEVNAAIASTTAVGVLPEQAITGLRQGIASIIKPSGEAADLAQRLGLGFGAAALKAKGLGPLLADIQQKTGGNVGLLTQLLGSVEAVTAIQPLLNDGLVRYNKNLENQAKALGVSEKAYKEVVNTIDGAVKQIQGSLSNLAVGLGAAFGPAILAGLQAVGGGIGLISTNLSTVLSFAAGLGVFVTILTLVANASRIAAAAQAALGVAAAFTQAVLNPAGLARVAVALAASAGAALLLKNQLDGVADAGKKSADADKAKEKAAAAINALKQKENENSQKGLDILRLTAKGTEDLARLNRQIGSEQLKNQIQLAEAQQSLSSALASLETARFTTVRSRIQFEIDNAQRLGLTEAQIAQRRTLLIDNEKRELIAKFVITQQQQQLEQRILVLKQQQLQAEAQIGIINQQGAVLAAQKALTTAKAGQDLVAIAEAETKVKQEQASLDLATLKLTILQQIAPIENQIAAAQRETTQQQLLQQGAALGIEATLRNLTPEVLQQNRAWRESVQATTAISGGLSTINGGLAQTNQNVDALVTGFIQVGQNSIVLTDGKLQTGTRTAAEAAGVLNRNMEGAAGAAGRFYNNLAAASGLAPARFTGGPVEGGGRYRINDGPGGMSLGQESFLSSSGDLSLIRSPSNSLWTAPSSGVVIPAGLTQRLQGQGAFDRNGRAAMVARQPAGRGPDPTMARLELAVSNLAGQVKLLTNKVWKVTVPVRNEAGTSQIRALNSLL